jgi:gliding motility-associated-like protein
LSGCFSTTTFDLIVGLIPETTFNPNADYEICPNASVPIQITATPDNFTLSEVSIVWYEDGDVIADETGLSIPVLVAGYYEIEVTFVNTGCTSISGVEVVESDNCIIPQVITPNGDGFNDTFDLSSFDVESLIIYNRYGTKVFVKTDGYTNQFEGIADNGDDLPVGTYFYVMKYEEGKVRTSWLYINK